MLPNYQGPKITLFNFEEPFAENSRYVLTSPRSLKACQIVGIKPVELLSKPLSEFENEYNGRLSYDLILERFQKKEQKRLGLLRRCRDERSKVVEEERQIQRNLIARKRTGNTQDFLSSGSEVEDFDISQSKTALKIHMASRDNDEYEIAEKHTRGSIARKSLSGRDLGRDSPQSPKSLRPNSQLASSGFLDSNHEPSTRFDSGLWRSLTESKPYVSKESAVQRHGWDEAYRKPRSPNLSRSQTPTPQRKSMKLQRTLSVDNIVLNLPAHVQKQASKLSENDQKILNIMISKANKEEVEKRLQAARKLELAEEHDIENELKQMKMKHHHMQLADKTRASQELRSNEIMMKTMHREERKRMQEENLARADEERELLRSMTKAGLVDRQDNATRTKEMQIQLFKSKQAMKNTEERERHEMKIEETKRRLKEDQMALQYSVESKHRRAELNNRYSGREKDFTLAANKVRGQRKKEQQEESLKKIQSDMEIWRKELQKYQYENEERAAENAKKNSYLKGRKAMMDRLQKEQDHLVNKEKIKRDEKARLTVLENSVKEKDMKSRMILEDKRYATKASRDAAMASRAIRDIIRDKTIKSSFDKMANEAEMMARIEKKGFQR